MVSVAQVQRGAQRFVENDLIPKVPGWQGVIMGAAAGIALSKAGDMIKSLGDIPIVKMLGVIDENGILYNGTLFSILRVGSGCYVLPERYLQPIYSDQLQLFERTMEATGEIYIIAKEGMFITAVFDASDPSAEMKEWMQKTCNAMNL